MIKRTHVILEEILKDKISGEWGKPDLDGTGVQIIRTTNFKNNGKLDLLNVAIRQISKSLVERKKLRNGDIILEKSGGSDNQPVGRVVFFDAGDRVPYLCNNFTQVLRADENLIRPKYLFYYLFYVYKLGLTERFQNKTTGIRNLKTERYLAQKVPLLPFEEQDRIIFTIQQVESVREKRRETIRLADEFLKSAFIDMFGDPIRNPKGLVTKKLSDFSEIRSGGTPSRKNASYFNGAIPWITTVALGKIYINERDAVERITDQAVRESATKIIEANSILFGVRVGVGKASINLCPICASQDVVGISLKDKSFVSEYLLFSLNSFLSVFSMSKRGATIQGITSNVIKNLKIPAPDIKLQQKFADLVQKVEALKAKQKQSETELQNLFNSLMQKAFKGEL